MDDKQPNNQEIRETLIQLHDALEHTHSLDENERALMSHLKQDIQELLDRSEQKGAVILPANAPLLERMETSVDLFEVSHPTLTAMIVRALDILNIAGI